MNGAMPTSFHVYSLKKKKTHIIKTIVIIGKFTYRIEIFSPIFIKVE